MDLIVNSVILATTDQGFLLKTSDWNEEVAKELAVRNDICLTEAHWEIILYIQYIRSIILRHLAEMPII